MNRVHLAVGAATAFVMLAAPAAFADSPGQTIYRTVQQPLPGNVDSVGFEATQASQLGDEVTFAHSQRRLATVTVTMSSWGCQQGAWYTGDCKTRSGARFSVPITLNLYNATTTAPSTTPVTPGSLLASVTKTFQIPYRPSASAKCTGTQAGEWFQEHHGCFNGKAANIVFNFSSLRLRLPGTVVYGVSYNTSDYGPEPIGDLTACHATPQGCPYDSLNVGLRRASRSDRSRIRARCSGTRRPPATCATRHRSSTCSTWTPRPAPAGPAISPPCSSGRRPELSRSRSGRARPVRPAAPIQSTRAVFP